jgi:hypothetical protein
MSVSQILSNATTNAAVVAKKASDTTMNIRSLMRITRVIKKVVGSAALD